MGQVRRLPVFQGQGEVHLHQTSEERLAQGLAAPGRAQLQGPINEVPVVEGIQAQRLVRRQDSHQGQGLFQARQTCARTRESDQAMGAGGQGSGVYAVP